MRASTKDAVFWTIYALIMGGFVVVSGMAFCDNREHPASLRAAVLRNVHLTYKPVEAER